MSMEFGSVPHLNSQPECCVTDLSEREIEIFRWVATGKSDWEISQILGISSKTVNYHVENVKRKFRVGTRIQAAVAVVRAGVLDQ